MSCPLCHQRKGRRQCPALDARICSVCCGTKRLTVIACPASCSYLATAREHPPAAVKRQQAHDAALLLPMMQGLSEPQSELFIACIHLLARYEPEGFSRLLDEDVADAAAAIAATAATAARGVVYEHVPTSLPAQRLAAEIRAAFAVWTQDGTSVDDRDTAAVFQAIERGARQTRGLAPDDHDEAYLALLRRVFQHAVETADREKPAAPATPLIVP